LSHSAAALDVTEPPTADDHACSGRSPGLMTLSCPEGRKRFSFLGTQAVPLLHFADTVANGTAVRAGPAAVAAGPWLRRTMHPVH
jgi:POT family proton-dependent oligopeptide transporter